MKLKKMSIVFIILLVLITIPQMFIHQVFAETKTITVSPEKTEIEKVSAKKGQIIEIGIQVTGTSDNNITFWVQDSDGKHVYNKKVVDLSMGKVTIPAEKDDTFQVFLQNISTKIFDDRKVTLTWNVKNPTCSEGTVFKNGDCVSNGGCLIATAAFGSELAPQVQFLREIRDNKVMSTASGVSFMTGFNQLYYSFSPTVADLEREHPIFKETVKIGITPMLSSLTIMSFADSEQEILTYGIGVILLNAGMYFALPVIAIIKVRDYFKK